MVSLQGRIDFIILNYGKGINPYDLATVLLNDNFTDDLDDLISLLNGVYSKEVNLEVISAFDNFN